MAEDPNVTQDERTMATLAHALQVICAWIAPLVIFLVKRESNFVRFHALQALFLQICIMAVWIILMFVWITTIFGFVLTNPAPKEPPIVMFIVFPIIWLGGMLGMALVITLAIVFAIKAGRGEWARYPVIGNLALRALHLPRPVS